MANLNTATRQVGFTLVELLISIVLGLLVVAAAVQLFITGQVSIALQRGSADILDNGSFGINYLTKDMRLLNLGAAVPIVDDTTAYGGVVLAQANVTPYVTIATGLLTRGNGQNGWTGASNVRTSADATLYSDQLTIQYEPVQTAVSRSEFATPLPIDAAALAAIQALYNGITIGYDCAGTKITLLEAKKSVHIVQRYFLRADSAANTSEPNAALALACVASRYMQDDVDVQTQNAAKTPPVAAVAIPLTGLDGAGQIIMSRVDYFHVMLGVAAGTFDTPTNLRYMSINDYMGLAAAKPRIRSVQLGLLVRATDSTGRNNQVSDTPTFTVLDSTVKVKSPTAGSDKYLRQTLMQTVALRNGLGE